MKLSEEFSPRPVKRAKVRELKKAMKKTKDTRMYERYLVILMALSGKEYAEISEVTGRSIPTICSYVKAYRKGGIDGLKMGRSTGRPSKLSPEQEQAVYETVVNKTPAEVGFPANMNWTSPLIRAWIKQDFGIEYSDRGTRDLLYRLNLRFTAPTYTLAKADPEKQRAFRQEFERFKKNS